MITPADLGHKVRYGADSATSSVALSKVAAGIHSDAIAALKYALQSGQGTWSSIMTQTADPALRKQQMAIRAVLLRNAERKLGGDKHRGRKWIRSKQAQCAIIGHVMVAKKCMYCGAEE